MRIVLVAISTLVLGFAAVRAQEAVYITAFESNVYFDVPDTTRWEVVRDELDTIKQKRILMFKHSPIKDSKGRMVSPVIAMNIDSLPDSTDLVMYSVNKRFAVQYTVTKVLVPSPEQFSYENAFGYLGTYTSYKVKHSIIVAHMIYKNLGVEIICDATTELMPKVRKDCNAFVKSIHFIEEE